MAIYGLTIIRRKVSTENAPFVTCGSQAAIYARKHIYKEAYFWREECHAILVDGSCRAVGHILISVGGMEGCTFDLRSIIFSALGAQAKGLILIHNHPSGNPRPSQADIENTDNIRKALSALGIRLFDHIILTEDAFYSFENESITNE